MKSWYSIPALVVGATLATGCYSYRPITSPTRGMDVRARLTAEAAARRSAGMEDPVLHYDGEVVEATTDSIAVNVLVARGSSAFQVVEIRDTVHLARVELQSILGRKFSAPKTLIVTVGAAAAAFAIVKGIDQIVGGTTDDEGNPPPPTARIPVIQWIGALLRPVLRSHR